MTALDKRLNELAKNLMISEIAKVQSLVKDAKLQYLTYHLYDAWTIDRLEEYGITLDMMKEYINEEITKLIDLYGEDDDE